MPRSVSWWTVGSVFVAGVTMLVAIPLLAWAFQEFFAVTDEARGELGDRPALPVLADMYDALEKIYTWLKKILTSKVGLAVLAAVSILLMALEVEWERRREEWW